MTKEITLISPSPPALTPNCPISKPDDKGLPVGEYNSGALGKFSIRPPCPLEAEVCNLRLPLKSPKSVASPAEAMVTKSIIL